MTATGSVVHSCGGIFCLLSLCVESWSCKSLLLLLFLASVGSAFSLSDSLPDLFQYKSEAVESAPANYVETVLQDVSDSIGFSMFIQEEKASVISWSCLVAIEFTVFPWNFSFHIDFLRLIGVYYVTKFAYCVCFGAVSVLENYCLYLLMLITIWKRLIQSLNRENDAMYPRFLRLQILFLILKALICLGSLIPSWECLNILFWGVVLTLEKYGAMLIIHFASGAELNVFVHNVSRAMPLLLTLEKDVAHSIGLELLLQIDLMLVVLAGVKFSESLFVLCFGEVPWLLSTWFYILVAVVSAFLLLFSWDISTKYLDVLLSNFIAIGLSIGVIKWGVSLVF